jgi:hypothetical protein
MSRDKLADIYIIAARKLQINILTGLLGKELSTKQVESLADMVLTSGGFREEYIEASKLLLTDNDIKDIIKFNEKYLEKINAMEGLMSAKTEEIQSRIDFDAIMLKLGLG